MAHLLRCRQGHEWRGSERAAPCPQCGQPPLSAAASSSRPPGAPPPATVTYSRPEQSTVSQAQASASASAPRERASAVPTVPGYEILKELGRGGMGVVYKARQVTLNRIVALKMILAGGHAGESHLARFRIEAEAVARLQHPGIVQIHETGVHDGLPYFSLEFVAGGSLDRKLQGSPLPPKTAARLTALLAQAIHAAHGQGILHRDLKPANVLLLPTNDKDGVPLEDRAGKTARFLPKIGDFGLAKKVDDEPGTTGSELTQSGAIMGTPSYMAPEQAAGKTRELTAAVDTYALGAILYELQTGRPPFRSATPLETVMQVVGEEPVPPSHLNARTPRDLETIALKCLHKDPRKRYGSAQDLAEDLERFLKGEPIQARPVGRVERTWRWCYRNPAVASLLGAVAATLLLGIVVSSTLAVFAFAKAEAAEKAEKAEKAQKDVAFELANKNADLAKENEEVAEKEKKAASDNLKLAMEKGELAKKNGDLAEQEKKQRLLADRRLYIQLLMDASKDLQAGDISRALRWLDRCPPEQRGWEHGLLLASCQRRMREIGGFPFVVSNLAVSPDGKRILVPCGDVKVFDAQTLQPTASPLAGIKECGWLAYSPDGKRILTATGAGFPGEVKVWDAETSQEILALKVPDRIGAVRADGKRLVSVGWDNTMIVWDVATGEALHSHKWHPDFIRCLAFSPDGKRIVSASTGFLKVWDAETGREIHTLRYPGNPSIDCAAFSPDSKRLITGGQDTTLKMWDADTGREVLAFPGHSEQVTSVAFSADGKRVVSGGMDHTVMVWDTGTGQALRTLRGHTNFVYCVAFSPDGKQVLSGGHDCTVKVWPLEGVQDARAFTAHTAPVKGVAFSPDGKRLASTSWDKAVKVWDVATGREVCSLKGFNAFVNCVAFSPDGKRVAAGGWDELGRVWEVDSGREVLTLKGHTSSIVSMVFSTDGKWIVTGGADWMVRVWDAETGREVRLLKGHVNCVFSVAISPDGKQVVAGAAEGIIKVWDRETGKELLPLQGHTGAVMSVAFSPDGKRLVSGSWDFSIRVWDAQTSQQLRVITGHTKYIDSVAYSPDGKWIASAGWEKTVKVWEAETGQEIMTLTGAPGTVSSVAFSPDGQRLAAGTGQGSVAQGMGEVMVWEGSIRPENR